jgi:lambda family phage tail tape measure protein
MADVIGQAVIEVTADASGVSAGIAQATQAVKAFEQAAVSSGTKAGAALTKATKDTSVTSAQLTREQERLISTIDRYSQTVGKTRGEVLELRAAQGGVTSQVQAQIAAIKAAEAAQAAAAQTTAKQAEAQRDLARAQREAAQAQTRKEDFVSSLRLQADSIGKTRSQLLELQAAQLGVTAQAAPFIARIRESEAALGKGGKELNKYGQSAAQTAAALRGVPAQVTDIVTSLQGGQAPLTVFLQQGGQLRDMFGGVTPAAKALGGALLGLINPFTVVAAAVATLGVAYFQGSKEADDYRKALVLTGNVAGLTTAQLQIMARNIDASVGTQHQAAEALAAIAATGQVAGTDLEKFGATAVRISRTVGTSIEDTAKQFAELGKDPVRASEKLNESMNYLTLAVYDQIRAAQENGREQEAASIAQNAYADAMDKRTAKLEANLGIIQRAWRTVSDVAKEGWDQILGIGRPDGPGENAMPRWSAAALAPALLPGEIGRGLRGLISNATTSDADREAAAETRRLAARSATAEAAMEREQAITNKMQIDARKRLDEQKKATRSRAEQRADEIKQLDRDAKAVGLSSDEYNKRVAAINEKYKDPKGPKAREFQDDAATKYLMQLRETEASLKEQLTQNEKLTASQRELARFEQQIADIKEKKTLTADQKSLLANQSAIEAQLKKNVEIENEVKAREKATKELEKQKKQADDFARTIQGINISIESSAQSRGEQQDRSLAAFGLGDRARQEVEAQRSIRTEYERYLRQLTKDAAEKNQLGSDAYKEEVDKIKASLDEQIANLQNYFDREKALREDWRTGAATALANYIDEIDNASKRTQDLVTNSLGGVTDGITGLLTGDKGSSFKDIGKRIAEQITRGIVEQQITKPLAEWLQGSLKDGDSLIGNLLGGLTSNKATGENWLGFLGLGGSKSSSSGAGAGLASVSTSSNTAATSLVSLAEAANQASFSLGGNGSSGLGGSGGGFLDSLVSGIAGAFGGFSNSAATSMANAAGTGLDGLFRYTNNFAGRAFGGAANAGSMYEVAENGPELLTMGNKTLLMMGKESGQVTPMKSQGRSISVKNTFVLQQPASRETQAQISRRTGQSVDVAIRRNS